LNEIEHSVRVWIYDVHNPASKLRQPTRNLQKRILRVVGEEPNTPVHLIFNVKGKHKPFLAAASVRQAGTHRYNSAILFRNHCISLCSQAALIDAHVPGEVQIRSQRVDPRLLPCWDVRCVVDQIVRIEIVVES
jgi:hypothetical protein